MSSSLFETLCASWTCMSIFFAKLWKFFYVIFSSKFSISCSSSSPAGTPMIQMLVHLQISQRLLILLFLLKVYLYLFFILLYSCFFLLFSLNASFFPYVPNHWFESRLPPFEFFPCRFFFCLCNLPFFLGLFYAIALLNEFLEHPDYQCCELCI